MFYRKKMKILFSSKNQKTPIKSKNEENFECSIEKNWKFYFLQKNKEHQKTHKRRKLRMFYRKKWKFYFHQRTPKN